MLVLWPTISTDNRKQFSRLLAREPTATGEREKIGKKRKKRKKRKIGKKRKKRKKRKKKRK